MSFIYIWKSENIEPEHAAAKFSSIIRQQATLYSSAYGRDFSWSSKAIGEIHIGQIDLIKGVNEWESWVDCDRYGIAWSGVCDHFLGIHLDAEQIKSIHDISLSEPKTMAEWSGNFAFAAWDSENETITINAGATQSQPLWYTRGPQGWACGSRSAVVLDMVGRDKVFDSDQARLFLVSSYHMADNAFFQGVNRLEPRHQILLRRSNRPVFQEYVTLADYLTSGFEPATESGEIYHICAENVRSRVRRQIRHSQHPVLLLSGGKDSRAIGAAIYKNGDSITSLAGGATGSPELEIARNVSRVLGFAHTVDLHQADLLSLLVSQPDRAKLWLRLCEGLQNLRQGLHDGFFNERLPIYDVDTQFFLGLHYGMLKPKTLNWGSKTQFKGRFLRYGVKPGGRSSETISDLIEKTDNTKKSILNDTESDESWAFMFYWQNRGSLWGSDAISVMLPAAWWWTPLVDRTLVQYTWWLFNERQRGTSLVDEMTAINAPQLGLVPDIYERKRSKGKWGRVQDKISRKVTSSKPYKSFFKNAYRFNSQYFPISNQREKMWQEFFENNTFAWREFCDKECVRDIIKRKPDSSILWNLATIELFSQEYL